MRISTRLVIIIVLCVLAGLFIFRFLSRKSATTARRVNVPLVKVSAPVLRDVMDELHFSGDILAIRQADIVAKVGGNLEKTFIEMGTTVREDQLLALIDTTELFQQYQQTSATYQNAKLLFDRTKDLFDKNLAAKQDLDNTDAALQVAKANFDLTATKLSYAKITAPFSGIVTKRWLDPGALVNAGGTTLFSLANMDEVKVIINILEKNISQVTIGGIATLTVDAYPDRVFTGHITRFSEAVDLNTRTMAVEIAVPNSDHALKPGMYASVTLALAKHAAAFTVPTPALQKDDRGNYIFIVQADTARKVRVTPGIEQGTFTEIVTGLSDTTSKVITTGQQFARDGGPVQLQP